MNKPFMPLRILLLSVQSSELNALTVWLFKHGLPLVVVPS